MKALIELFEKLGFTVTDSILFQNEIEIELNGDLDVKTNADIFLYFLDVCLKNGIFLRGCISLNANCIEYTILNEFLEYDIENLERLVEER